ncbi:MAG: DNA-binding protein [Lachnospiraceae bacterium]|nr:DNA-binding protein [Lachnospiraceae bacterium]
MNGYIKVSDASKRWGISNRRIVTLCNEGRIDGAVKFGNTWAIPKDTEKPKDERIRKCIRKSIWEGIVVRILE